MHTNFLGQIMFRYKLLVEHTKRAIIQLHYNQLFSIHNEQWILYWAMLFVFTVFFRRAIVLVNRKLRTFSDIQIIF